MAQPRYISPLGVVQPLRAVELHLNCRGSMPPETFPYTCDQAAIEPAVGNMKGRKGAENIRKQNTKKQYVSCLSAGSNKCFILPRDLYSVSPGLKFTRKWTWGAKELSLLLLHCSRQLLPIFGYVYLQQQLIALYCGRPGGSMGNPETFVTQVMSSIFARVTRKWDWFHSTPRKEK